MQGYIFDILQLYFATNDRRLSLQLRCWISFFFLISKFAVVYNWCHPSMNMYCMLLYIPYLAFKCSNNRDMDRERQTDKSLFRQVLCVYFKPEVIKLRFNLNVHLTIKESYRQLYETKATDVKTLFNLMKKHPF